MVYRCDRIKMSQNNNDLVDGLLCLGANADTTAGIKRIPVRFLYDDKGSDLYEQITRTPEYYPYAEEKRLLSLHSKDIVSHIPKNSVLVELGCGDGSKTALLLEALTERDGCEQVRFIGIDCSAGALTQAKKNLQAHCPLIPEPNLEFIAAEYLEGMEEARRRHPNALLCMLWLGSSIGNFTSPDAVTFLRNLRRATGDRAALLLCTDLWKDAATLHAAYDDAQGVTRQFIINGMVHALRTLRHPAAELKESIWTYEAVVNSKLHQVEMWVAATEPVNDIFANAGVFELEKKVVNFVSGERILMEISRKFTKENVASLAFESGYSVHAFWGSKKYGMQLLLPIAEALRSCWRDTEALFAGIPDWSVKPIGLRHPFGFYFGHVAAFSLLKNQAGAAGFIPSKLDLLYSRGIDPNVHDPSVCHSHPQVPDSWPNETETREYAVLAKARVLDLVVSETADMRALMMTIEHERMHQETLCYMLTAHRKNVWNPSSPRDVFSAAIYGEASKIGRFALDSPNRSNVAAPFYFDRCSYRRTSALSSVSPGPRDEWVLVTGGMVALGVDRDKLRGFLWDNELCAGPQEEKYVADLRVSTNPITVSQFREFVLDKMGYSDPTNWESQLDYEFFQQFKAPASWTLGSIENRGDILVHAAEATYKWTDVADCPVYCSLAEASAFCKFKGSRVMTEFESILIEKSDAAPEIIKSMSADGWEWTCTPFAPLVGFVADPLYPEYSADFFDNEHFVLRGSGCYTHSSMIRSSFRNFFQKSYPHVLAKFRLVQNA